MHPNERLVREFYEARARFNAGETGPDEIEALLAPDIVWHVPGRSAIAGDYHKREAVLSYFARRAEAFPSFRIDVRRILADDELVLQLAAGHAEIAGKQHAWETIGVFRISDGRIAECWLVPFDQYAFDEIWA
jgi:ketosteroid isomerase-like protein